MSARGSHRPAKNISGKNTIRPMTLALFAVLATAAITSPMGKSPAMHSRAESANPPGLFGAGAPKAAMLTPTMTTSPVSATHSWITPWAASSQDWGTGVVDRRRRTPSSR